MEDLRQSSVQECLSRLSIAESPSDAVLAWTSLQGRHSDLVGFVCLESYKRSALPLSIKKYTKSPIEYLVPYFETHHIYFLEDELLSDMFDSKEIKFGIDYTLMFDTNIASYINRLVRGEPLGKLQPKIITLVDEILNDDLNFDSLFYMVENVKDLLHLVESGGMSKMSFWKSLNKDFRNNLISLQLFSSIDCKEYKKNCNPKPVFSYREAAKRAIDFSYDFYMSKAGKEHLVEFLIIQRLILLQLIGMVRIQLSSNRNAKNKMIEYFDYIHEVVGAYFDRESIVAHKYFLDRKNVEIFHKIQKGRGTIRLLKQLDNIAWDMASPRFMEKLIVAMNGIGEGRYFIPMFISFDKKLRNLLSLYPVKGAVYSKSESTLLPIPKINTMEYFRHHGCDKKLEYLYSEPIKSERMARGKPTRKSVHKLIKQEYSILRKLLTA